MTEQRLLNTTSPSSNLGRKVAEGTLLALFFFGPRDTEPQSLPAEFSNSTDSYEAVNYPQDTVQDSGRRQEVDDQSNCLNLLSVPAQPGPNQELLAPSVDLTLRFMGASQGNTALEKAHALIATPDQLSQALAEIQRSGETIKEIVLVNGEPKLNALGNILPESSSIYPWAPQIADAPGRFVLSTREPGLYHVVVYGEGFITHVEPPIELTKGRREYLEISLSLGQEFTGFLYDADTYAPIHNARVILTPIELSAQTSGASEPLVDQVTTNSVGLARVKVTKSDTLGEFKFTGLHSGPAHLTTSAPGYVDDFRALELGKENLSRVYLLPERTVSIQLINARTNEPFRAARCNGFLLREVAPDHTRTSILPGNQADENGVVLIGGILPQRMLQNGTEQIYILELYDPDQNLKLSLPTGFSAKELVEQAEAREPIALLPITSNRIILKTGRDTLTENESFWIEATQVTNSSEPKELYSWPLTNLEEPASPNERRFLYSPRWAKYSSEPTEIMLKVYKNGDVLITHSLGAPGALNDEDVYIDL